MPYVNEKRTTPDQHALLICDAHVSRINEEALQTLKRNNIDMIILPAHSTSKYQPLDVGIYSSYKDNFRRYYRGKGGLYNLLFSSINAFQCSFIPTKIQDAWEASHILDENINEYLNTLKDSEWKNRVPVPTMQIIFVLVVIIITYGILDLLSNNVVYSMNCMLLKRPS